ncbi:hypothetical protein [Streptomyces sp. NPDC002067]
MPPGAEPPRGAAARHDRYHPPGGLLPPELPRADVMRPKIPFRGPLTAGVLREPHPGDDGDPAVFEMPDHWWPEDRAWCLGADVDLESSYLGGSEERIAEVLAAPGLETFRVEAGRRT